MDLIDSSKSSEEVKKDKRNCRRLRIRFVIANDKFCVMQLNNSSNVCKIKVKLSLEQAMKAQRGSRGIALFFL